MHKSVVIIGGGPAGLAAAIGAYESGVEANDILIIEREKELGGVLNQCVHTGFGLTYFGEELSGGEYASRFIEKIEEYAIPYVTEATVLSVSKSKVIKFVSPQLGYTKVKADAVVLAMGCRERSRGTLNIAGTRPSGIFSAGSAQRFVNIEGYLPGKRIVILGSGDIGLIMARRLTLEGAKVLRVCEMKSHVSGSARNVEQCLNDFDIPLYLNSTVTKIVGEERVTGVVVSKVDENFKPIRGTGELVRCDTLVLSIGLIPENELTTEAGIKLDKKTNGAVVDQYFQTSLSGVFACGNVLHVHDIVDYVTAESINVGKACAGYVKGLIKPNKTKIPFEISDGVKYVVPQTFNFDPKKIDIILKRFVVYFRVSRDYEKAKITITSNGEELLSVIKNNIHSSQMHSVILTKKMAQVIEKNKNAKISVTEA
ncbi:MAG: FAD-dependent oxidoreductase [Clostridia bacterium]|nr:FAD-dependent oxidoreductase [Clostridia bacterium]